MHLHATDAVDAAGPEAEWLITLEPSGFRWSHTHAKGAAAVRGPVGELYLFVWGRRTRRPRRSRSSAITRCWTTGS
ncbi:hypothetical protein ACFQ9X_46530 [Catenulispora yoronensis]